MDQAFPGQEDSEDSGEAAFLGPPNAEPLQHIVHREAGEAEASAPAVRLLGLETVSFQKSIWDAAVIVMLHAGGGARKVVGNFNVALKKWGNLVLERFIGSLRRVSSAPNRSLLEKFSFERQCVCSFGPCEPLCRQTDGVVERKQF